MRTITRMSAPALALALAAPLAAQHTHECNGKPCAATAPASAAIEAPRHGAWGIDVAGMDRLVSSRLQTSDFRRQKSDVF